MRDSKNEEINPEDYWPEAEQLLNQHFTAKKRRRMIVYFSFFLAGALGVLFLLMNGKEEGRVAVESGHTTVMQPASPAVAGRSLITDVNSQTVKSETIRSTVSAASGSTNTPGFSTSAEKKVKELPVSLKVSETTDTFAAVTAVKGLNAQNASETVLHDGIEKEELSWMALREIQPIRPDSVADYFRAERRSGMLKHSSRWDLLLYAGGGIVRKEMSGTANSVYLNRREQEERPAFLPYAGLQLSRSINSWDLRGGVEFAVAGEQVNYSPYSKGEYYNSYQEWEPYSYTVSDTDSTYIFGILFLNTRQETINDSLYVTRTDTLNGLHYDPSLRAANGINRWYIVEMPLEVVFNLKKGRWGAGISAGIAPGVIVQSSGRYLRDDESGVTKFENENRGKMTLNARAGLEFSYLMNSNCRLMLRPSGRYFLTKMDGGHQTKQRYSSIGINAGIFYMLP